MSTQRYKLTISYRGTQYHGWQTQYANRYWKGPKPREGRGIPTIQELMKHALQSVVGHPVILSGSSRTDAGVHAKAQVAHFDTPRWDIPAKGLRDATNARLPDDIFINSIEPVADSFDAVYSTISKRYQYFIWNSPDRSAFHSDLMWHRWQRLDTDAMNEAGQVLVGEHDFTSFSRPGHGRDSTIRTIYSCDVCCRYPRLIVGIHGNGFLWNMVRIVVGTLVEVGMGRYGAAKVKEMLEAADRKAAGPTAPPGGLYLQWIKYPLEHSLQSPENNLPQIDP